MNSVWVILDVESAWLTENVITQCMYDDDFYVSVYETASHVFLYCLIYSLGQPVTADDKDKVAS